ncbi:MAG: hypothetical protein VXU48_00895, partial [Verrucomicrobiota bacterium]|nr:hypothetical protein [Verrucomicrobiota bacterium]
MKIKTLTAILSSALLILSFSNAQLVISQYAEEGNIKGIEIWNPTTSDVVFSEENTLIIDQYTNGSTTPSTKFTQTSGTIAAGQVAVYADGSVNSIWNSITFSEVNFSYNGDDAISISLGGTVIDVFGTIGEDPGSSWSGNSVSTADQNIALKTDIITGSTGWSDPSSRFETIANKPLDSTATDAVNLSGFGVAPVLSGDTGGGDTGGGDTGGGDTGGGDTGGGDTGGGDTGGGDTGGGDTGGGDTG